MPWQNQKRNYLIVLLPNFYRLYLLKVKYYYNRHHKKSFLLKYHVILETNNLFRNV